jgi:hypothetical protein
LLAGKIDPVNNVINPDHLQRDKVIGKGEGDLSLQGSEVFLEYFL